jgi:hypothetical protein
MAVYRQSACRRNRTQIDADCAGIFRELQNVEEPLSSFSLRHVALRLPVAHLMLMSSAGLLLKLDRLLLKKLGIAYQPGSILGEAHARRCIRVPSRLLAPKPGNLAQFHCRTHFS